MLWGEEKNFTKSNSLSCHFEGNKKKIIFCIQEEHVWINDVFFCFSLKKGFVSLLCLTHTDDRRMWTYFKKKKAKVLQDPAWMNKPGYLRGALNLHADPGWHRRWARNSGSTEHVNLYVKYRLQGGTELSTVTKQGKLARKVSCCHILNFYLSFHFFLVVSCPR